LWQCWIVSGTAIWTMQRASAAKRSRGAAAVRAQYDWMHLHNPGLLFKLQTPRGGLGLENGCRACEWRGTLPLVVSQLTLTVQTIKLEQIPHGREEECSHVALDEGV